MGKVSAWLLALLSPLYAVAVHAQAPEIDHTMLNGNWEAVMDIEDGGRRAFVFSHSSVDLAFQDAEGILYVFASFVLTRSGERVRLTIDGYRQNAEGIPELVSTEPQIVDLTPAGDGFDMWKPDDPAHLGRLVRTNCDLTMTWRDRTETPPEGCTFVEIVGVGFDGLTGQCEYHQEWADNWDEIRRMPDGSVAPMACLVTAPASFAD